MVLDIIRWARRDKNGVNGGSDMKGVKRKERRK